MVVTSLFLRLTVLMAENKHLVKGFFLSIYHLLLFPLKSMGVLSGSKSRPVLNAYSIANPNYTKIMSQAPQYHIGGVHMCFVWLKFLFF